jgi:hypothetical protein
MFCEIEIISHFLINIEEDNSVDYKKRLLIFFSDNLLRSTYKL